MTTKERSAEKGTMSGPNTHLPNPECVVKVGDGRGFIIEQRVRVPHKHPKWRKFIERRFIVTAAHCLPKLPPPHRAYYEPERAFEKLLASLDGTKTDISTECLFVDPVADIALLGSPDPEEWGDKSAAYSALVDDAPTLRMGSPRSGRGWVLSLDGQWVRTEVKLRSDSLGASLEIDPTSPGMSGSPILNDSGRAVGVISTGHATLVDGKLTNIRADGQPVLTRDLPAWLLKS